MSKIIQKGEWCFQIFGQLRLETQYMNLQTQLWLKKYLLELKKPLADFLFEKVFFSLSA